MTRQRFTPLAIALVIGATVSALRIGGCQPLDMLDLRALDYRLRQRGTEPATSEVVIVGVDDDSLRELGRWPWSRAMQARLLERVAADGPAVIGADIVQSEKTASVAFEQLDGSIEASCLAAVRDAINGAQSDDAQLAEAVRNSQRTVLGYFFTFEGKGETTPTLEGAYPLVQRAPESRMDAVLQAPVVTQNLPELAAAARGLGYFNFFPDADGIYRRAPLALRFGDRVTLPLSLAMLQLYWPDRTPAVRFGPAGVEAVRIGTLDLPVEEDGQLLIDYRGPARSFRHFSAADVLAGRLPEGTFRDKLVLLGVTAVGASHDVVAVPFDPVFPGVEVHANVLDNILRTDFIYRPRWLGSASAGLADVAVILVLVFGLALALDPLRGRVGAIVAVAAFAAYLVLTQLLFTSSGIVLSVIYPSLAIGLTYLAISVEHYALADREKRHTRRMLDLYLSPSLATFISERPETLKLGGEKRERTVLFSDIKSFTTIAEGMEPEPLVELLNLYLGEMTDIVFAHDGMLDKYIGDGVMAVWGAPLPQSNHAARACHAALAMIDKLGELNKECAERGWPKLSIRIGLNSGPMVFGNVGSAGHLSLTVMGDNVNLGARLEGINKLYGTTIIASGATVYEASDLIVVRDLDMVRVKGKAQAARIYEVLGPADSAPRWAELIEHFHEGLAAYRSRDWDAAIASFARALRVRPDDGPSVLYMRRAQDFLREPPPPEWEPVTTFGEA